MTAPPARRRFHLWAARLGLLSAGLCAALLLLVLIDPFLPGVDWVPAAPSEDFHHTRLPGVWMAQQWEWGPNRIHIDAAGWREAPESAGGESVRPAGERFRMAVMGDSYVEAVEVAWEDTFVARLQARSGGRAEVLNRGTSAYSPLISLLRWRRQVVHERPTHLLLLLCSNDVVEDRKYTDNALRRGGGEDVARLYWRLPPGPERREEENRLRTMYRRWHGRAAIVVASLREVPPRDPDAPADRWRWPVRNWRRQNRDLPPLTARYVRELMTRAREAGVEFTLSAVPNKWELGGHVSEPELRAATTFADHVAAWAAANGVRYVDLQAAFREAAAQGQPLFFKVDPHFAPAGHAVAAEAIAAVHPELFGAAGAPRDRFGGASRGEASMGPAEASRTGAGSGRNPPAGSCAGGGA